MKNILYVMLVILFVSCNEENYTIDKSDNPSSKVLQLKDYYDLITNDSKNQILIESMGSINDANRLYAVSSSVVGGNQPLNFTIDGEVFNGDKQINKSSVGSNWRINNKDLSNLYGKKVKIIFNKSDTGTSRRNAREGEETTELYIPEQIRSNVSGLVDGKVVAGTKFSWNADTNNDNGVILAVEYKPSSQANKEIVGNGRKSFARANAKEGQNENIVRGISTGDNGSYQISSSDLSEFPDGATLSFYVLRAGFATVSNEKDDDITIGAYSAVRADFNIDK